jgi:hypothetical protein
MLCIWWDMKGVIYFELLDTNHTITVDVYSQQLQRLHEALLQKELGAVGRTIIRRIDDSSNVEWFFVEWTVSRKFFVEKSLVEGSLVEWHFVEKFFVENY